MKISKIATKWLSVAATAVMLLSMASAGFGVSAAAQTKKFLDPFDESSYQQVNGHWTFTKADRYTVTLPDNYDVDLAKIDGNGGVFGFNPNKPALAAFNTGKTLKLFKEIYGDTPYTRKSNLMKNYVAVETEMVYHFANGFKDFEFMGIASSDSGSGNWAGAYGMEENPPVEFYYSDRADGGWKAMKYASLRVMPAAEASTYCYFTNGERNTSSAKPTIPTSARYLKIRFKNGCTYDKTSGHWEENYKNWQCVLGYLLVNEYTAPQSGNSGSGNQSTVSKPGSGNQTGSGNSGSVSRPDGGNTASGSVSDTDSDNTVDVSQTPDGNQPDTPDKPANGTAGLTDQEVIAKYGDGNTQFEKHMDGDSVIYVLTSRKNDWVFNGILIGCNVVVLAGIAVAAILIARKKGSRQ